MWLQNDIVEAVDRLARIYYVNVSDTKLWNMHRREGELRLLTGWVWTAKDNKSFRQGFKSKTVCYRDAWYALVQKTAAPALTRPRLRVVAAARKVA